jgi:HrpA-like RNA helicase
MSATINTDRFVEYFTKKARDIVQFEPPVIELKTVVQHPVYYYYLDSLIGQVPIKVFCFL